MHNFSLGIILNFLVLMPALLGAARSRQVIKGHLPFLYLMWLGLLNEILSVVMIYQFRSNAVNANAFVLMEYLLIIFQFYKWNNSNHKRYITAGLIGFIVWLMDNFILHNITDNNSFFRVFYAMVIILFCINQVSKLLLEQKGNLLRDSTFIICISFLFYYGCKAFVEAFNLFNFGLSNMVLWNMYIILYFVNAIANVLFTLAVLCIPTKQEFTMPY